MQKIPSAFLADGSLNPDAAWVAEGKGYATLQYDGDPVMVRERRLYRVVRVKAGRQVPEGFEETRVDPDGTRRGWVKVGDEPDSEHLREVWSRLDRSKVLDGTYELVGDKLLWHGLRRLDAPRDVEGLRSYFERSSAAGIVWHYPQGDGSRLMAKVRRSDPCFAS